MKKLFVLIALPIFLNLHGQTLEDYTKERAQLIANDQTHYFANTVLLSKKEEKVNTYLRSLQEQELKKIPFIPSKNFLKYKKEIEASDLYKFLQKMPKGAILHAHAQSLGDLRWLVKNATYRPDCYIYTGPTEGNLQKGCMAIFEKPPGKNWEQVVTLRQKSDSISLFDENIYDSFTVGIKDINADHIWDKFQSCFSCFAKLLKDINLYKPFIKNALLQLLREDNVQYIEVRDLPHENLIIMYKELIEEIQKEFPYFSLKVICCHARHSVTKKVLDRGIETLNLQKKYPELIAGFDLVGEEDKNHTTFYYIEDLLELNREAALAHLPWHYYFHGGETNWPFCASLKQENSTPIFCNDNLYDVLLLHSKRVGHGLSLIKNPFLLQQFKKAGIPIEVCPISNQVLEYVADLRNHPAIHYLNAGLAITINPDDPGVFGYKGVTADYWEACLAWQLDLKALKQLTINSIMYSSLDEPKKTALFKTWQQKWDEFINEMQKDIN